MKSKLGLLLVSSLVMVSGCATIPPGPSVMVMPSQGASFEEFRADDLICKAWAKDQSGWDANETVNQNLASGAAVGTLMGAAAGALIGAASGNPGAGLAIGAGGGLLAGTAVASNHAFGAGGEVQRRYDNAYQQCMFSKGHQIPSAAPEPRRTRYLPPPPPPRGYSSLPPPPPSRGYSAYRPPYY
jgi:hypothetical protein